MAGGGRIIAAAVLFIKDEESLWTTQNRSGGDSSIEGHKLGFMSDRQRE